MAFRYVVKKRMVGIGTKTEKYVAASYSVANIDFDRLCDQVTSQGMVPRGIVKAVLDGMIDALCTYASIGATVRLGDFGSLLPPETDFRAGTTFEEHDETIGHHTIGNRL